MKKTLHPLPHPLPHSQNHGNKHKKHLLPPSSSHLEANTPLMIILSANSVFKVKLFYFMAKIFIIYVIFNFIWYFLKWTKKNFILELNKSYMGVGVTIQVSLTHHWSTKVIQAEISNPSYQKASWHMTCHFFFYNYFVFLFIYLIVFIDITF